MASDARAGSARKAVAVILSEQLLLQRRRAIEGSASCQNKALANVLRSRHLMLLSRRALMTTEHRAAWWRN